MPIVVDPAVKAAGLRELADAIEHMETARMSESWDTSVIVFPRSVAETLYLTDGRNWRRDESHDTPLRQCIAVEFPGRVHAWLYVSDAVLHDFIELNGGVVV